MCNPRSAEYRACFFGDSDMKIEIEGFEADVSRELMVATEFYSNIILHPNISEVVSIHIQNNPDNVMPGETFADNIRQRAFTIEIRGHPADDNIFQTLAHELVHVKQWATRELQTIWSLYHESPGHTQLWYGRLWKPRPNQDPYFDCPWEIEAYGREIGLHHRWKLFKEGLPWK